MKGHGAWLWDSSGKQYLDFIQGWAVNALGHCPDEIVQTITHQSQTLLNCSPAYYNKPMLALAQKLVQISCCDQVFFTNSGAEANESAIKLARKWGSLHKNGAFEIITCENGFHGRTLATMSASGKAAWKSLFEPKVPGFIHVPFNDLSAVESAITDRTVAVMIELIQGEGGVVPASAEFVVGLRALAKKHQILLVFDEVQTGMGRTGTVFAYEGYDVNPDILTLGKGLGGGVPIGAMLCRKEISCFEFGDQGGTYNGNPLMTAVGLAVVEKIISPGFLDKVNNLSEHLVSKLGTVLRGATLRGKGLLQAAVFQEDIAPKIAQNAFENGLLLNAPRPNVLRFMPALTVTDREIDQMVTLLKKSL